MPERPVLAVETAAWSTHPQQSRAETTRHAPSGSLARSRVHIHASPWSTTVPARKMHKENIMKIQTLIPALLITVAASGCATWDNMSSREKSAATGAAVGGVAGAVISNGGVLGTVGGAAIGGVIGDQVGKNK
jgi:osmotically inducible lipoprotein OsmB